MLHFFVLQVEGSRQETWRLLLGGKLNGNRSIWQLKITCCSLLHPLLSSTAFLPPSDFEPQPLAFSDFGRKRKMLKENAWNQTSACIVQLTRPNTHTDQMSDTYLPSQNANTSHIAHRWPRAECSTTPEAHSCISQQKDWPLITSLPYNWALLDKQRFSPTQRPS